MENANIESISNIDQESTKFKVEYVIENVIMNPAGNYSEMGDNDIRELIPEVEIGKLVCLGYFDSQ